MSVMVKMECTVQLKPRIRLRRDEYAEKTGNIWYCSNDLFCASGKTPAEAYRKFARFRIQLRDRDLLRPVRHLVTVA